MCCGVRVRWDGCAFMCAVVCVYVYMWCCVCMWCCVWLWCCVCLSSYMSLSLFFFSFLFSLFSFISSFIFSFSLFHCTHRDEINQTSDSTNQERPCTTRSTESRESYQSVTSWEVFACWVKLSHKLHSWWCPSVHAWFSCSTFYLRCLGLDSAFLKILCIEKLMTANCSAECPTQHMRRSCGAEDV